MHFVAARNGEPAFDHDGVGKVFELGAFRAENKDDILAIPSPALQGFGYFQNVGQTRRQGIELMGSGRWGDLTLTLRYNHIDATFQSRFVAASQP